MATCSWPAQAGWQAPLTASHAEVPVCMLCAGPTRRQRSTSAWGMCMSPGLSRWVLSPLCTCRLPSIKPTASRHSACVVHVLVVPTAGGAATAGLPHLAALVSFPCAQPLAQCCATLHVDMPDVAPSCSLGLTCDVARMCAPGVAAGAVRERVGVAAGGRPPRGIGRRCADRLQRQVDLRGRAHQDAGGRPRQILWPHHKGVGVSKL